jgi:hypothetical protein
MENAPSDKCAKCNWWLLLGEIREEFEMRLLDTKYEYLIHSKSLQIEKIKSIFTRSAHKVCREHWEGKR